ncbi:hypothetical protein DRH29_03615 [candidate division Kazan bacterium]|uniref:Uncharacterized protein n=1 Tax=candidate division Kazan bacterium TaxID=2202143 RepID=A0A420ZBW6_UNCK3|nr:MAG: hypothetical protein DRH29_03615 [candidate division Kazan bacterium]
MVAPQAFLKETEILFSINTWHFTKFCRRRRHLGKSSGMQIFRKTVVMQVREDQIAKQFEFDSRDKF